MHRYERFMAGHPRLALALVVAGLSSLIIGAAGIPSDIEAWGNAFAWLGSDGGRWLLAASGFLVIVAAGVVPRVAPATQSTGNSVPEADAATKDGNAGELRVEVVALGDLRTGSESIFEVRFKNSTESDLTNVAVNVDLPQEFGIRRSTQDGGDRPGGSVLTSGDRRFWQGIVSPLRGFGTTTVEHFAVVPGTAGNFDLVLKVQLDGGPWEGWPQTFSVDPVEPRKPDFSGGSPQGAAHDLADYYKEGDRLREECKPPDDASTVQLLMWNLGGNPRQIELEKKAREWDAAVSGYLWDRDELKILGPGWKSAGDPPGVAAGLDQSRTTPATLGKWYETKLAALTGIIEKVV